MSSPEPTRCLVLRCGAPAGGAFTMQHINNPVDPTGPLLPWQAPVCLRHKAMLEDEKVPWKYDPAAVSGGRGSIVMGDDFDAAGIMITDVLGSSGHADDVHPNGGHTVTVTVERLRGDGSREELKLFFCEELITKVKRF